MKRDHRDRETVHQVRCRGKVGMLTPKDGQQEPGTSQISWVL